MDNTNKDKGEADFSKENQDAQGIAGGHFVPDELPHRTLKFEKYEFTSNTMNLGDTELHQIRAVQDFADVKKGDLGGFVQSEKNLSHEGNAWIYDNALAYGNARVSEDASLKGRAEVFGSARLAGTSQVSGFSKVFDNAIISGAAAISGQANVYGDAIVSGDATVKDMAKVLGNARVSDKAEISGAAIVRDYARVNFAAVVSGTAMVGGNAVVTDFASIQSGSKVMDNARIGGCTTVKDNSIIAGKTRMLNTEVISGSEIVDGVKTGQMNYPPAARTTTDKDMATADLSGEIPDLRPHKIMEVGNKMAEELFDNISKEQDKTENQLRR